MTADDFGQKTIDHLLWRRNLVQTKWCRAALRGKGIGPTIRFHFVLSGWSPHLWVNLGRLEVSLHRYESPVKQWKADL